MNHIIIAGDSRGRGIDSYISNNNAFTSDQVHYIIKPGGTLSTIFQQVQSRIHAIQHNHNTTNILCTITAGICNLTQKIYHEGGMEICYKHNTDNIINIKQQISTYYRLMNDQNVKFNLTHIPSASLSKYSEFNIKNGKLTQSAFSTSELEQQQSLLESDLEDINNHISTLNSSFHTFSVRWDRDLVKCRTKTRGKNGKLSKKCKVTTYTDLYDGVHANAGLKDKWFHFLVKSIETSLSPHHTDSDSEPETSSWDFKRCKLDE